MQREGKKSSGEALTNVRMNIERVFRNISKNFRDRLQNLNRMIKVPVLFLSCRYVLHLSVCEYSTRYFSCMRTELKFLIIFAVDV